MIAPGQRITDWQGTQYMVQRELGQGGQGQVFEVSAGSSYTRHVAKVYDPSLWTVDHAQRINRLVDLRLPSLSSALCGPTIRLHPNHGLGTIAPIAEGATLESVLSCGRISFVNGLVIGATLSHAVGILERNGIAHGDIAASNVMVAFSNVPLVSVIDLDNAALPGAPPPQFRGQDFYAAPEILLHGATACINSDRWALGVLLHELLLRRHPFSELFAQGASFDSYLKVLQRAKWIEDPALALMKSPPQSGLLLAAYPRTIHDLFRDSLQTDPGRRRTADEWAWTLERALDHVYVCWKCKGEFVNEATRFACPHCASPAELLALQIAGKRIVLSKLVTTIGRAQVRGDTSVSREHAVFRRWGYGLYVTNRSRNGLSVRTPKRWVDVEYGREFEVCPGDRIRFAPGVEGLMEEVAA